MKPTTVQRQEDGSYAVQMTGKIGPHQMPDSYWIAVSPAKAIELVRQGCYLARKDEVVV